MQNKANFPDDQMNVTSFFTVDYENIANWKVRKNKANSKPNKANLQNAQMNVNFYSTKEYENISNCSLAENKPNTKPIQTQTKPISPQKIMLFKSLSGKWSVKDYVCTVPYNMVK